MQLQIGKRQSVVWVVLAPQRGSRENQFPGGYVTRGRTSSPLGASPAACFSQASLEPAACAGSLCWPPLSMSPTSARRRPRQEPRPATAMAARRLVVTGVHVVSVFCFLLASPCTITTTTAVDASVPFAPGGNLFRGVGDDSPLARTLKGAGATQFGGEPGSRKTRRNRFY